MNRAASAGVALLWLAGCTSFQPVPQYAAAPSPSYMPPPSYSPPRYYQPQPAPPPPGGSWLIPRAEAAPPQHVQPTQPPLLRSVDPPDSHEVDQSCGWWRLCNFWSGS